MDISLFQALPRDQIRTLYREVRRAFDEHVRWVCRCQATLLAGQTPDAEDLHPEAHTRCDFGLWYHGSHPDPLSESEEFKRIGELHRRFHDAVRLVCQATVDGSSPPSVAYDRLIRAQSIFLIRLNEYLCDVAGSDRLFDPLTGVLNRQEMLRMIRREQARTQRTGQPCALALADLDHFKNINDSFGHEVGDRMLQMAADRFQAHLRSYDLLFRYGGEEFLFCLPGSDMKEANRVAERVRRQMECMELRLGLGRVARVTVSFGLSELNSEASVEDSVRAADRALYEAKAAGRNRIRRQLPISA